MLYTKFLQSKMLLFDFSHFSFLFSGIFGALKKQNMLTIKKRRSIFPNLSDIILKRREIKFKSQTIACFLQQQDRVKDFSSMKKSVHWICSLWPLQGSKTVRRITPPGGQLFNLPLRITISLEEYCRLKSKNTSMSSLEIPNFTLI